MPNNDDSVSFDIPFSRISEGSKVIDFPGQFKDVKPRSIFAPSIVLDPATLTTALDAVTTKLHQMAEENNLVSLFTDRGEGILLPELRATLTGEAYDQLRAQLAFAVRYEQAQPWLRRSLVIVVAAGLGYTGWRYAQARGWTDRLETRGRSLAGRLAKLNPLKRRKSPDQADRFDEAALVRLGQDIAAGPMSMAELVYIMASEQSEVTVEIVIEDGDTPTVDAVEGRIRLEVQAETLTFMVDTPQGLVIFEPQHLKGVTTAFTQTGQSATITLEGIDWPPAGAEKALSKKRPARQH